jgi:hypothetical protein
VSQDFIFSSHLLEHIKDHEKALREWWRVLRPGGHLCLYLPHKDFYPNIGTDGANPDHVHDFHPDDIIAAMKKIGGWDLVENQERNGGNEYSFFQVYKKYADIKMHRFSYKEPKPEKTCAIVRYGAWGDVIQMTSVLPALKAEGYHITLYTVPRAWEAVKHEPLIDKVILQDTEQVPNLWLGDFFAPENEIRRFHQPLRIGRGLAAGNAGAPRCTTGRKRRGTSTWITTTLSSRTSSRRCISRSR